VDALIEVWGAGRVGVHLAPRGDEHDMGDHDPRETFGYALEQLGQRKIAFFFTREYLADDSISDYLKQRSNGVPYIANMRLSREDAVDLLASGKADAVSFGKAYIANPDLFERLLANAALNELQLENMIGTDVAEGYIDYPSMKNKFGSGRSTY
jgi:NADH:flavin oxidoreductases, Old Yellow Enzyme family